MQLIYGHAAMALHHILMGDIIKSSEYDARKLRGDFINVTSACNNELSNQILSPYTITLGDEFQGIASSLVAVVRSIFFMEETILGQRLGFKVRYVVFRGDVDTDINQLNAHTMMGPGLTAARKMLTDKRRGLPRFRFALDDKYKMKQLNRLFLALDGITGRWDLDDGKLILDMVANSHNGQVGKVHGKNRSQIWKRRKNLLIEEYRALKEAVVDLAR